MFALEIFTSFYYGNRWQLSLSYLGALPKCLHYGPHAAGDCGCNDTHIRHPIAIILIQTGKSFSPSSSQVENVLQSLTSLSILLRGSLVDNFLLVLCQLQPPQPPENAPQSQSVVVCWELACPSVTQTLPYAAPKSPKEALTRSQSPS